MNRRFLYLFLLFAALVESKETKLVMITGCPRSGTIFMAQFLNLSGLQVGNEKIGRDGLVSWAGIENKSVSLPWTTIEEEVEYKHIFHQVRNPLDVISSWIKNVRDLDGLPWRFIRSLVPEISREDSLLVHGVKFYCYWNLKAEKIAHWRYKIEDLEEILPELGFRLGVKLDKNILTMLPQTINRWQPIKEKITWKELKRTIPDDLFSLLQTTASRYGYPTTDMPKRDAQKNRSSAKKLF